MFTRHTSRLTVRTSHLLLCSHPSLLSSSSHILTLQAVICWPQEQTAQGPDVAKSLSVSCRVVAHLPDLLHSAAQNWAKYCHTYCVGTGCKLLPYFLAPPFLPSTPFNFVMLENRVHNPKSKPRWAQFCKAWGSLNMFWCWVSKISPLYG